MKYSICLPVYKAKFLRETIFSILDQSYKEFELIILNDNSPEPVEDIINSFTDSRIRYAKNQFNIGSERLVDNWNKCLALARYDFVMVMGDDDVLDKGYLAEFNNLMSEYPDLMVYHCRSIIINEHSDPILLTPSWPSYESVYDNLWHRLNNKRLQYISDFVYRRNYLLDIGGYKYFPLAWGSDDVTAYVAASVNGIAHSNSPVFKYRMSRYTISSLGSGLLKMQAVLDQRLWLQEFLKSKPNDFKDLIIYEDLVKNVSKIFRKKQIRVIEVSLDFSFFSTIFKWVSNRKKYQLAYSDIFLGIIINLKNRLIK